MDMRKLLEAMYKFAGGPEQKQGPAGQLRGGEKMPKKGSKKHPAYHKLVGGGAESIEPHTNMLGELDKFSKETALEHKLKEMWALFKEADLGVEPKRPSRKGSRPSRGHEPTPRYKTIKEEPMSAASTMANTSATTSAVASTQQAGKEALALNKLKSAVNIRGTTSQLSNVLDTAAAGQAVPPAKMQQSADLFKAIDSVATNPATSGQLATLIRQAQRQQPK